MFFSWTLLLVLLVTIIAFWAIKRWRSMQVLQALGYAVPPLSFIGGNLLELVTKNDLETQIRWMTEIARPIGSRGKILGWYRGNMPVIYCTDPEFLKEMFIKDSENFIDRPMIDRSDNIPHLIMLKGSRWKHVRATLTPTFSAAKMRRMSAVMSEAVDTMVGIIKGYSDREEDVNFHSLYQGLTLDVIGQCGLGMKVNCQLDEKEELLQMVKKSLKQQIDTTAIVSAFFPEVEFLMANLFRGGRKKTNDVIISWCQEILDKRRKMKGSPTDDVPIDSLQLMMDAADGKSGKNKIITDEEITANAFVFILAGYETTATTLAFTTYLISQHPDVQEKIHEEIESIFGDTSFSPDKKDSAWADDIGEKVGRLQYMDMVLNESMRIYCPIPLHVGRWAEKERTIMGYTIPAGSAVMAPTWYIHHDPELWPDPWKFDPERFAPENKGNIKEMSYMPFGEGPRKCIGWRFAMLEAKLALVQILKNFKLEPSEKTISPLQFRNKGITLAPKGDQIFVRVAKR